jgi:hypothetical protein
VWLSRIR